MFGIEEVDEFANGGLKALDGVLSGFAQERLQLGKGVFDRLVMMTLLSGFLLRRVRG